MKKGIFTSVLCLVLLLAVLAAGVYGVNGFTAPIVAENERLAADAAAEAEKALLGDSELLYDRADEAASTLAVTADTVQSVYRDAAKQTYLLRLETSEGYSKQPIKLLLTIDFEGKVVDLSIEENPDDKELGEEFPQSFAGQDSTLAGVELVAGVTFSSSAIRGAVNDGFNTLIDNGLFAANEEKLIGFDFAGLEKDVLYKASLAPVIYNGNHPASTKLLYEASEDTVAFFRLVGSDMNIDIEGRHATVSGTGFSPYAYRLLMANEEIGSVDVRSYTGGFPADVSAPANPNVIFYAASEAQMSGRNVVVDGLCKELVLQVGYNFDPASSFTATKATVVGESVLCTNDSYYWNTLVLPFEMPVPTGVLARRFTGPTATTESCCPTFYAGTPYVYLTLDDIDFTAENVAVKSLADMPASTGYMNFIGTFVNFPADGTSQAITTGTAMSFPEAGTEVKALTAYRTVACTLANMAGAVRVDSKMHSFVQAIVAARETLELYREERSAADIATFEEAIATAEQQMTAMPETFQERSQLYDAITAATQTYANATPLAVSELKADGKESAGDAAIYDINGRRLKAVPEKGFYIINGKAYIK